MPHSCSAARESESGFCAFGPCSATPPWEAGCVGLSLGEGQWPRLRFGPIWPLGSIMPVKSFGLALPRQSQVGLEIQEIYGRLTFKSMICVACK